MASWFVLSETTQVILSGEILHSLTYLNGDACWFPRSSINGATKRYLGEIHTGLLYRKRVRYFRQVGCPLPHPTMGQREERGMSIFNERNERHDCTKLIWT